MSSWNSRFELRSKQRLKLQTDRIMVNLKQSRKFTTSNMHGLAPFKSWIAWRWRFLEFVFFYAISCCSLEFGDFNIVGLLLAPVRVPSRIHLSTTVTEKVTLIVILYPENAGYWWILLWRDQHKSIMLSCKYGELGVSFFIAANDYIIYFSFPWK